MTAELLLRAALAEVAAYVDASKVIPSLAYARLSLRQYEIFELVAAWNRDYYGASAIGDVLAGQANLRDVLTGADVDAHPAQRIERVEISDPGTAEYSAGERVHLVPVNEAEFSLQPSVTFRDGVFEQVRTDLAGVLKVRVFYARRPRPIAIKTDTTELLPPFAELLVLDLGKHLVARLPVQLREAAIGMLQPREDALLALLEAHVRGYSGAVESRF